MASSYEADGATEALIAQLMAEDFAEAYTDHMRPIGSHAGDYEEPLTSYERQCLDNPDMEDGEGGWNPPSPTIEPVEGPTLAEGESWDSRINNDPRIESTPAGMSSQDAKPDKDASEGGVELENSLQEVLNTLDYSSEPEEPLHHIQDPIDYHTNAPTQRLTRHASMPIQELVSPTENGRRVISDPSRLESTTDEPPQDPPNPTPFAPTTATHSRLLDLLTTTSTLNLERSNHLNTPANLPSALQTFDSTISTSSLQNNGKGQATDTATTNSNDRMREFMNRYHEAFISKRDAEIAYLKTKKGKGKAREGEDNWDEQLDDEIGYLKTKKGKGKGKGKEREGSNNWDAQLDDGVRGDESFDGGSGMLFLRIPWPDSSRRDREFREAMEAQVHEIWVGEEETVESILRDVAEREEVRERPWGSWGIDAGGRGGGWEKGKGKAVEC